MIKLDRITRVAVLLAAFCILFCSVSAPGQSVTGEAPHPSPMHAVKSPGGFIATNDREALDVTVCGAALIHVTARPLGAPPATEFQPWMLAKAETCPGAAFQFSESNGDAGLTTAQLAVSLSEPDGNLTFKTAQGGELLHERPNLPRTYLTLRSAGTLPH